MKTKFSCETSFKTCQLKLCKGKLARAHSSKSASWRYENEAPVRGSFNICKLKLCNGSFRGDFLQNLQVEDVKTCENEAFVQDFLPKLLFAGDGSLQSLLYCSHCFLAVIFPCGHSLRSFLFPVIVLYSHCALPSLCFAVMVLCSHGSLQCWNRMQQRDQQKDFLSRKYKHETVSYNGGQIVINLHCSFSFQSWTISSKLQVPSHLQCSYTHLQNLSISIYEIGCDQSPWNRLWSKE